MSTGFTYRFDKDIPLGPWISLFKACNYNKSWTERHARASLDYCYLVGTAWNGDAMVGTVSVQSDGVNFAVIDDLVVHPTYRSRGIALTLVRSALDRIKPLGLEIVQLYPIPGRETFFARLGFHIQPDSTVMDFVSEPHVDSYPT